MTKASLRNAYLLKRKNLTEVDFRDKNRRICERAMELLSSYPNSTVHIFLPHPGKHEVDTTQFISNIRTVFPQIRLVAPYVIPGTFEMRHFELKQDTVLRPNQWKIPEPDPETSTEIKAKELDLIFIPLLAFDSKGFRVGYGGGFYDRFLSSCRKDAFKVGVSFFEPVEVISDKDQFDIRLNACITPDHLYQF